MALINRRTFFRTLLGSALTAGGLGTYARFGEPHWLEVDRRTIALAKGGQKLRPIRVLHLSDFHDSPAVSLEFIGEAIRLGLAQRPDVILVTGDFFTTRMSDPQRYATLLRRLSAAAPTFACLGNHDGGAWARNAGGYATTDQAAELLEFANIVCLQNEAREIFVNGRKCQIFGVADLWSRACEPALAFGRAPERAGATRILLNHNPDAKIIMKPYDWDLMLCGHTHGGQLRLPFIGTPFAPVSDKRYVEGLHVWENRSIYITRGVGNLHGLRLNCRPQLSVLELV